jgi:hypothetical protein
MYGLEILLGTSAYFTSPAERHLHVLVIAQHISPRRAYNAGEPQGSLAEHWPESSGEPVADRLDVTYP